MCRQNSGTQLVIPQATQQPLVRMQLVLCVQFIQFYHWLCTRNHSKICGSRHQQRLPLTPVNSYALLKVKEYYFGYNTKYCINAALIHTSTTIKHHLKIACQFILLFLQFFNPNTFGMQSGYQDQQPQQQQQEDANVSIQQNYVKDSQTIM